MSTVASGVLRPVHDRDDWPLRFDERTVLRVLGLAAAYIVAARLGLVLAVPPGVVTPVWAPAGIALASMLLFGTRVWPGVLLGAFLANLQPGVPVLAASGIAVGNTLEAVVGASLLRAITGFRGLGRVRDVLALATVGALGATTIAATVGATTLWATGLITSDGYAFQWRVWWLGDAMGVLLVAPLLLAWLGRQPREAAGRRMVEGLAVGLATAFVATISFIGGELAYSYGLFPLLLWSALRFQDRAVTAAGFGVSAVALWGALRGAPPVAGGTTTDTLLLLQALVSIVVITALVIGAAVRERDHAYRDRALVERAVSAVTSDLDPATGFRRYVDVLRDVVPNLAAASLSVIEGGEYRRLLTAGPEAAAIPLGERLPVAGSAIERTHQERRPVVIQDVAESSFHHDQDRDDGIASYVTLPLVDDGRPFANLNVGFVDRGRVSDESVHVLELLTVAIVPGIKNALLYEQQQQVIRDLEELDAWRTRFTAMVTHDLRTPLAAVAGFAEVLLRDGDELEEAEIRNILVSIKGNAVRLDDLAAQIAELGRIDSDEFRPAPSVFDVVQLTRRTADEITAATTRPITVRVTDGAVAEARADERQIWRILTNLLSNAVKYSPPETPVEVTVSVGPDRIDVAVRDLGPGITPADRERIFDRFHRGRPGGDGLGLGLYISRRLAVANGAVVEVDRDVSEGSVFRLSLPKATATIT